jgi:response regulator RpfG family c-di-GMP phosphodiesterase
VREGSGTLFDPEVVDACLAVASMIESDVLVPA